MPIVPASRAFEAELLGDLAQHGGFGMLAALEEARDEPVPVRRTADAVHEHDAARALDDGGDDGHGIAPVHEAALRAREPRLAAALGGRELRRGSAGSNDSPCPPWL